MYGFGSNNTTYQPPPPLQHTDAAYREAIARQQAQYDAFARAHQQQAQQHAQRQTDIHQQLFQQAAADQQRLNQQAQQFQQDFLRGAGAMGGRMPETFHNFGRDSDDEDDAMSSGRRRDRMDVDSTGPAFPQANIPSFPQPSYTSAPPPTFPTPQQPTSAYPYPQPGRSRQQPSLRTQHEAATRIQRFWRNFLSLRTWRRNASLHQLALLRRKFDGLVSEFAPPPTLAYAPTPDAAEIQVSTAAVPYGSFIRLSSEALSSMGRAPPLSFNASMKPIHATSEEFVRVLGKLDAVNSWGDPKVREARKALAGAVEGEASRLDSWVKVVWFARDGKAPPAMPKLETVGGMPTFPEPTPTPTPTRMPQPQPQTQGQNEQQAWEQELQSRERRKSYQPPSGPPPQSHSQSIPSTHGQEHPSLRQLSDLRAQFASIKAEFAVPEVLEYTLQPARSMSNGLELIARLETSFLSYHAFSPPRSSAQVPTSTAKLYSGPPLAFSSTNKPVHSYNEALLQMLGKLDAVESGGDARVRDARKGLAGDVEGEAGRLEGWWKEAWVLRGGEAEVVKVRT